MTVAGHIFQRAVIALVGGVLLSVVHAQEHRLRWNGFVSVGAGITFDDTETFLADPTTGSVYDDHIGFRPDTILGLQATAELEEGLSATAQIVGRGGDDFDVELEWAYISYVLSDEVTLSAGRRRIPLYYYSATLDLGYSYHWIRPPYEVYHLALTAYEGVSLLYKSYLGDWYSKVNLWAGEAEAPIPAIAGMTMELNDMIGLAWNIGYDERVNFRAVYSYQVVDLYTSGVLVTEGDTIDFMGAAAAVDYESWFIVGEYTTILVERSFNHIHSWYVSGGLRIGEFTPHITFAEFKEKSSTTINAEEQQNITVGLRYDFHPHAALKLEFTSVNDRSDLPETLNGDSEVIVLALDLTF